MTNVLLLDIVLNAQDIFMYSCRLYLYLIEYTGLEFGCVTWLRIIRMEVHAFDSVQRHCCVPQARMIR